MAQSYLAYRRASRYIFAASLCLTMAERAVRTRMVSTLATSVITLRCRNNALSPRCRGAPASVLSAIPDK